MYKRIAMFLGLISLLLIVGCQPQYGITLPTISATPTPTVVVQTIAPIVDRTWISPAKVSVANFHEGARAEYPITIHNGNSVATKFSIYYRIPDYPRADYVLATNQEQDWVIVTDATPLLEPGETREVLVSLAMPNKAISPAPKWEFWIGVMDKSQTGMVVTELCSRWEINMR